MVLTFTFSSNLRTLKKRCSAGAVVRMVTPSSLHAISHMISSSDHVIKGHDHMTRYSDHVTCWAVSGGTNDLNVWIL